MKWTHFYTHVVLNIFSRYAVGWMVVSWPPMEVDATGCRIVTALWTMRTPLHDPVLCSLVTVSIARPKPFCLT